MSTVEFSSDMVRNAKFRDKMRGYHPDDVQAFLERTAVAIDVMQTRLNEMSERALRAEAALESNSETDESIRRTLTLAQRTAELAVSEARQEAEQIRADADAAAAEAQASAEQRTTEAAAEAARVVEEATAEAGRRLEQADREVESLAAESAERIAAASQAADQEVAERRETARRELDEMIAELTGRQLQLRSQVEALEAYLSDERVRVLDTLTEAVQQLGAALEPAPPPQAVADVLAEPWPEPVEPAMAWPDEDEEGEPTGAWMLDEQAEPEGFPEAEIEAPVEEPRDESAAGVPSALLFTVEDETRRVEAERAEADSRPRKTLLGRRRS